jgi:hypothetical protein
MGPLTAWLETRADAVNFYNECLRDYRETRREFDYAYSPADAAALRRCGADPAPIGLGLAAAAAAWWGSGRAVAAARAGRPLPGPARAAAAVARLFLAAEALRAGHLLGSHRQGSACMRRLVALHTPLGGELAAIVRARDPAHPLLAYERPPAEAALGEGRPRIRAEENRAAARAAAATPAPPARAPPPAGASDTGGDVFGGLLAPWAVDEAGVVGGVGGAPAAAAAEHEPRRWRRRVRRHVDAD